MHNPSSARLFNLISTEYGNPAIATDATERVSLTEVVLVQQDVIVRWPAGALDARMRQQEEIVLRGVGDPAVHDCMPTPNHQPQSTGSDLHALPSRVQHKKVWRTMHRGQVHEHQQARWRHSVD